MTQLPSLQELLSLEGKVVAITGAGSGIGKATARRVAEAGATVILADMNEDNVKELRTELEDGDYKVGTAILNVLDLDSIDQAIQQIVEQHDTIDAWVNIAGIFPGTDTLNMAEKEWDMMLDINLKGSFFAAQKAAKVMVDQGKGGVIVNTHSTTAERPVPGLVHYVASKTGVDGLTRGLAKELGPKGIRVLAVSPTMVQTPGMADQKEGLSMAFGENPFEAYASQLPLQRLATPDEIARVMLFAISDLSSIMTGSILYADAGDKLV